MSSNSINDGSLTFPIEFPITFTEVSSGITFPITFPISFNTVSSGITFPMSFPIKFTKNVNKVTKLFKIIENVNLDIYHGETKFKVTEIPTGKISKFKVTESAWDFKGLIVDENIISKVTNEIVVNENVQALILVDFELISTNELKLTWYGSSVPSFTIMKKSSTDTDYISSGSYSWDDDYATVTIESEDYDVYLDGNSSSGSSAIYTIAGVSDKLVLPEVKVLLNEKIYTADIDYTSVYKFTIDY